MKMFTYSELEVQTKKQLLELVKWNGIGTISKYAKKAEIIDFILEKAYNEDVVEEEPPASARIRRIRRASK